MHITNYLKNQKGIGLIEVILALGVSVIVITGMVSLAVFTVRSSLQSRLLFEGTKYANQQLEFVRALRDKSTTTWTNFKSSMGSCNVACYMIDTNTVTAGTKTYGSGLSAVTVSFRASDATTNLAVGAGTTVIRITGNASWLISGVTKTAYVYTDLTNWRGK